MTGIGAGANVMDVYARTNALNQTVVYALVNSFDASDATNGLYVSDDSNNFTQLTAANAHLDSNLLSAISGTGSSLYVGSMALDSRNPNFLANYNHPSNINKLDLH